MKRMVWATGEPAYFSPAGSRGQPKKPEAEREREMVHVMSQNLQVSQHFNGR
jgi:hypothetical protein